MTYNPILISAGLLVGFAAFPLWFWWLRRRGWSWWGALLVVVGTTAALTALRMARADII